mmetsp:Transcript_53407/g.141589  ORF Transcript_53407/g.141589 Transcript_53407/m.141589 type:complete len:290 (-) Transcript_53407:581-1450(-)
MFRSRGPGLRIDVCISPRPETTDRDSRSPPRPSLPLRSLRRWLRWEGVFVDDGDMEAAYGAQWSASAAVFPGAQWPVVAQLLVIIRIVACWQSGSFGSKTQDWVETSFGVGAALLRVLPLLLPSDNHGPDDADGFSPTTPPQRRLWRFVAAMSATVLSCAWCAGSPWFFARHSAVQVLLGIAMVAAVGAGSFVYASVTGVLCLSLAASGVAELWGRLSGGRDEGDVAPPPMGIEQAQSYTMALLLVSTICTYAIADARRQDRERFRRHYLQERLRFEREARRRGRAKSD